MTLACVLDPADGRTRFEQLASEPEAIRDWLVKQTASQCRVSFEVGPRAGLLYERGGREPGVSLLRTIKGVGPRTAEVVVAWIDPVERFSRSRDVGKYFGLTPRLDESAGKARRGHITKQGPSVVRWLRVEAAWRVIRVNAALKAFYQRVRGDDPRRTKIAVVAVARKLSTMMAAMLRDGTCWQQDPHSKLHLATLAHKRD